MYVFTSLIITQTALVARKHGAVVCPRLIDLAGESVPATWALHERLMRHTLQQETSSCADPPGCSD